MYVRRIQKQILIIRLQSIYFIHCLLPFYMLTEEGRGLGKAMVEASKEWKVMEPRIDNSSDTALETAIKEIILQMLRLNLPIGSLLHKWLTG